jgi:succinate dehydrogenase/fumarate reductase flavoprotein subunit
LIDIQARQAVIMTTGGFEFNERMKLDYLKVFPSYFLGTPANTGDGHRMVMEVGADLWHMNCCAARFVAKFPDFPYAFSMEFAGGDSDVRRAQGGVTKSPSGYIVVDRSGKRFTSENFKAHFLYYELALYDSQRNTYPRVPCFWIFDSRRMKCGPLPLGVLGCSGPTRLYPWTADNQLELQKGWIVEGKTLKQLAEKLEIPAAELQHTVRTYNTYCRQENDPEFHRRVSDLVPIVSPPYYAVRLYPGGPNTQGGPRRDHRGRVINVYGSPVPGLYAAGEFGSIYGMSYPSGGANLGECIAFGRIAAENAVKEEPGS